MTKRRTTGQPKIPMKGPHTEAPKPQPIVISLTPEQVEGVKSRQLTVQTASQDLNSFIGGVVTGHGHRAVNVTGFDPNARTLTVIPLRLPENPTSD